MGATYANIQELTETMEVLHVSHDEIAEEMAAARAAVHEVADEARAARTAALGSSDRAAAVEAAVVGLARQLEDAAAELEGRVGQLETQLGNTSDQWVQQLGVNHTFGCQLAALEAQVQTGFQRCGAQLQLCHAEAQHAKELAAALGSQRPPEVPQAPLPSSSHSVSPVELERIRGSLSALRLEMEAQTRARLAAEHQLRTEVTAVVTAISQGCQAKLAKAAAETGALKAQNAALSAHLTQVSSRLLQVERAIAAQTFLGSASAARAPQNAAAPPPVTTAPIPPLSSLGTWAQSRRSGADCAEHNRSTCS